MIASVTEELFSERETSTLKLVNTCQEILVSMVSKLLKITGLLTILTTLIIKPATQVCSKVLTHFLIKIRDAIAMRPNKLYPPAWSNPSKSTGEQSIEREKLKLKKLELKLLPLQPPRKPRKKESLKRKD